MAAAKDEAAPEVETFVEPVEEVTPARGRSVTKGSNRVARESTDSQGKEASQPHDETLPEFDPAKLTPGYIPKTVVKGEDEYMIVVSGVKARGGVGRGGVGR